MWGYLSEFWNSITAVADYPVEFFESIGNAVAGAVGGMFEDLIHHLYDVFNTTHWFLDSLKSLLTIAFSPLVWVFNFFNGFVEASTSSLSELGIELETVEFMQGTLVDFLNAIPHFWLIPAGVSGVLGLLVVFFILKKLVNV